MTRIFTIPAFLLLVLATLGLQGQELNTTQRAQVAKLEHQFMSPCCYGEQLYGHLSPQALEMKQQISQMVLEGRTDREIIDHFKAQFGARILVEPEGAQWWVMNVVPIALLILGFAATVWVIRKWYRPVTPRAA